MLFIVLIIIGTASTPFNLHFLFIFIFYSIIFFFLKKYFFFLKYLNCYMNYYRHLLFLLIKIFFGLLLSVCMGKSQMIFFLFVFNTDSFTVVLFFVIFIPFINLHFGGNLHFYHYCYHCSCCFLTLLEILLFE